jgi:hypothetical protein
MQQGTGAWPTARADPDGAWSGNPSTNTHVHEIRFPPVHLVALTRTQRRLATGAVAVLGLIVVAAGALRLWLPGDAEIAARLASEFEQRTGVGLTIGSLHWSVRPLPVVSVSEVTTQQKQPITVRRLSVQLSWSALLQRRVQIARIEIDGAVLPRASVREFRGRGDDLGRMPTGGFGAGIFTFADVPVEHVRFEDVRWVDQTGLALAYDGHVDFDAGWRPRHAEVVRPGTTPPVKLTLEHEAWTPARTAEVDRWRVEIDVGGGTWSGRSLLETMDGGKWRITAQLEPRNVDVTQLVEAFGRRSAIAGRLYGKTELHMEAADPGNLISTLHTRTPFTIKPATLLRFDLAKAVKTAGTQRDGQTPLDELGGTLDTQATDDGTQLRFTNLKARSGLLTASGNATVLNRKLSGEAAVDLVDGIVGVPFRISGTTEAPELSLTGAALTGAAIGTAVLPGVGTAIGARIGQQVERLFGGKKKPGAPTK